MDLHLVQVQVKKRSTKNNQVYTKINFLNWKTFTSLIFFLIQIVSG